MLVVPVPNADPGPPLQGVPRAEAPQQKILRSEVKKETGRWKDWWKVRDFLADGRCSRAVLDLLATTAVRRRVPAEEDDVVSVASELEVRDRLDENGAGAGGGGRVLG